MNLPMFKTFNEKGQRTHSFFSSMRAKLAVVGDLLVGESETRRANVHYSNPVFDNSHEHCVYDGV